MNAQELLPREGSPVEPVPPTTPTSAITAEDVWLVFAGPTPNHSSRAERPDPIPHLRPLAGGLR